MHALLHVRSHHAAILNRPTYRASNLHATSHRIHNKYEVQNFRGPCGAQLRTKRENAAVAMCLLDFPGDLGSLFLFPCGGRSGLAATTLGTISCHPLLYRSPGSTAWHCQPLALSRANASQRVYIPSRSNTK